MTAFRPPGWPDSVRPPGAEGWEEGAVAFLFDCCPADFRAYPVLRRHPLVLARFAAHFLDTVGETRPVVLIGNSLGGAVAQRFAVAYPERTRALVLVNSAGFGREVAAVLRALSVPRLGELLLQPGEFGRDCRQALERLALPVAEVGLALGPRGAAPVGEFLEPGDVPALLFLDRQAVPLGFEQREPGADLVLGETGAHRLDLARDGNALVDPATGRRRRRTTGPSPALAPSRHGRVGASLVGPSRGEVSAGARPPRRARSSPRP